MRGRERIRGWIEKERRVSVLTESKDYKKILEKTYKKQTLQLKDLQILLKNPIDEVSRIELLYVDNIFKAKIHFINSGFPIVVDVEESEW